MARWQEAPIVEGWQSAPVVEDKPGIGAKAARQTGLTARGAITGVATLPAMGADALAYVLNAGLRSLGIDYQFPPQMQALEQNLSAAGLPEPGTPAERVVYDINRALASTGGTVGAGRTLGGKAGELLAIRPGVQLESAAGAAGAAGSTRELGGGPVAQTVAGLVGGVGAPLVVRGAIGGVKAAVQPFTRGGREVVAGRALRGMTTDPESALLNLEDPQQFVPGSEPTTGQVARDVGLASAERALRSTPSGARIAERGMKQNTARSILLSDLAGTADDIAAAKVAREAATDPLREAAFANAKPANAQAVTGKIDQILASPSGKGETVKRALTWLKNLIGEETDPRSLYELRKDIGYAMEGKLSGERADFALAKKQLMEVRSALDDVIDEAAPGFKNYLSEYRAQSKPINQMETLQDIQSRVVNPGADTAGYNLISQAKFFNVVQKNKAELSKVLSKDQMEVLQNISRDLDRGQFAESAGKAIGSNTFQNFSTAHVLGAILGRKLNNPFARTLTKPLAWLYQQPDEAVRELLVDAMLDPALARAMMHKATPKNLEAVARELSLKAKLALGTTQAELTRTLPQAEESGSRR